MRHKIVIFGAIIAVAGAVLLLNELRLKRAGEAAPKDASFGNLASLLPPSERAKYKGLTEQELYTKSKGEIYHAWKAYWDGDLPGALKLFAAEKEQVPRAKYWQHYSDDLPAALQEYDQTFKALQGQLGKDLSPEQEDALNMKLYQLSKDFYDNHGMETEASGPMYGPEFYELEKKVEKFEGPAANKLILDWTQYDSCTSTQTASRAIEDLEGFLKKFPDSSRHGQVDDLLRFYRSGDAVCKGMK